MLLIMKVLIGLLVAVALGASVFLVYGRVKLKKPFPELFRLLHKYDITLVFLTAVMLIFIGLFCHHAPLEKFNQYYENYFTGTVLTVSFVEAYLITVKHM